MNKYILFLLLCLAACHRVGDKIEPKISYVVQDRYLKMLPSPFTPLSLSEREHAWGKEYQIGIAFARQVDLYQAITAFKRAEILVPDGHQERKLEMQYEIFLCYYIGKKYQEAIDYFDQSQLRGIDEHFPAYHDLLVILYDCYEQLGKCANAEQILDHMKTAFPTTEKKLAISSALTSGNIYTIEQLSMQYPSDSYLQYILNSYDAQKKSVGKAQALNALLPGAGYLYLGQTQSAITAFLLNGLFITASCIFFIDGNIPAGVIFTSFEAGWYFGGIYGGGEEAKFYNERTYEKIATPVMNQEHLFPILTLKYAF